MSAPLTKTPTTDSGESGLEKVAADKAAAILELYEPSDSATALLREDMAPDAFLEALLSDELYEDAISFLAYGLPRREAIWWGVQCVRQNTPEDVAEPEAAAIASTETWLDDPTDENRRAAFTASEAATYETPAGCLALAVFFSDGSLSPADCPPVPVGEVFCARTIAATLHLSTVIYEPEKAKETASAFVDLGIEVANQPAPWEEGAEGDGKESQE